MHTIPYNTTLAGEEAGNLLLKPTETQVSQSHQPTRIKAHPPHNDAMGLVKPRRVTNK